MKTYTLNSLNSSNPFSGTSSTFSFVRSFEKTTQTLQTLQDVPGDSLMAKIVTFLPTTLCMAEKDAFLLVGKGFYYDLLICNQ
jgi:hypothetical protein